MTLGEPDRDGGAPGRKKLVLFCDGTWNGLRMTDRTNVSRLAKCVRPSDDHGLPQVIFYDEGVGVDSHVGPVTDFFTKYLGGIFGLGMDRKVEAAYRFLVLNYEPGDDIYLFGFSRGAYTARSLCGMIRKVGILKRTCFDLTPRAFTLYRSHKPSNDPELVAFRFAYAHDVASGREDYAQYLDGASMAQLEEMVATAPVAPEACADGAALFQYRDTVATRELRLRPTAQQDETTRPKAPRVLHTYRLMYLGLWDTVNSLGVPDRFKLLSRIFNRQYGFYDANASGLISSLRHAVAVDENRRVFSSTPVSNIDDLNRTWAARRGYEVEDVGDGIEPERGAAADRFVPYAFRPYQQRWFPGDHGAVGGGNPQRGLYSHTLRWVAEGAEWAGLAIDWTSPELVQAFDDTNAQADWPDKGKKDILGWIGLWKARAGPKWSSEAGATTYIRYLRDPTYRPENLKALNGQPATRPHAVAPPTFPPLTEHCWPK